HTTNDYPRHSLRLGLDVPLYPMATYLQGRGMSMDFMHRTKRVQQCSSFLYSNTTAISRSIVTVFTLSTTSDEGKNGDKCLRHSKLRLYNPPRPLAPCPPAHAG
ncbi:unnamed protein product, partial [Ectocarpus sp. 12 AP-2014]